MVMVADPEKDLRGNSAFQGSKQVELDYHVMMLCLVDYVKVVPKGRLFGTYLS